MKRPAGPPPEILVAELLSTAIARAEKFGERVVYLTFEEARRAAQLLAPGPLAVCDAHFLAACEKAGHEIEAYSTAPLREACELCDSPPTRLIPRSLGP